MAAPVFALFSRTLYADSRARTTYVLRVILGFILFWALASASDGRGGTTAAGLQLLSALLYVNFASITLAGLYYFAAVITEEKEDETLGLLKMCNLGAAAILLGKSTSRLIAVVLLLLVQFPFTLLAVTLGGVSLGQVFAGYATLLAYLVLLSNVALVASVCLPTANWAGGLTALLLGILLFGGGILTGGASACPAQAGIADQLLWQTGRAIAGLDPLRRIAEVLGTGFAGPPVGFQVVGSIALAAAFFGLAWAAFGLFTEEQKSARRTPRLLPWLTSLRRIGVGRPGAFPIAWKDFHFLTGGYALLAIRFLAVAALSRGIVAYAPGGYGFDTTVERVGLTLITVCLAGAGIELVGHSANLFLQEARWHTLPELMVLPLTTSEIVQSKFLSLAPVMLTYGAGILLGAILCPTAGGMLAEQLESPFLWVFLAQIPAFVFLHARMCLVYRRIGTLLALGLWLLTLVLLYAVGAVVVALISLFIGGPASLVAGALNMCFLFAVIASSYYGRLLRQIEALSGQ